MNREKTMTASGVNVVAGLWLILAPFILGFSGTALSTNSIIVGIIVTILSIVKLSATMSSNWIGWVNGVLGLWLLITPLVFAMVTVAATWNNVIVGLIVAASSIWSASSATIGHGHPKMG